MITIVRRARTLLWTALSIVIVASAVLVGVGKLLMPYSAHYQPRLEAWLSREFGRPVELQSFTGEWRAFGPQLTLKGMRLLPVEGEPGEVAIEEAVIDVRPLNALLPSRALYNFRVVGADFRLLHRLDGGYELSGLGVGDSDGRGEAASGKSSLGQLASVSEVIIQDSSLRYDDERNDIHLGLTAINGRLQQRGSELMVAIGARLSDAQAGVVYGDVEATASLKLDGLQNPRAARWKLSGQELMLGHLEPRLPASPFAPQFGRFNAEMWGEWDRERRHRIRGVADLRDARLVNEHMDLSLERVNTRFHLAYTAKDDWRLDLSGFQFEAGERSLTIPAVSLARKLSAGVGLWVGADMLRVEIPVEIARQVVQLYGKTWPHYVPGGAHGELRDFDMVLDGGMKLRMATGDFRDAGVTDWGRWPDMRGFDGRLTFGPGHGGITAAGEDVVVEWPRMFPEPVALAVPRCSVEFTWGNGYQVNVRDCLVENEAVSAFGDMRFSGSRGRRPVVDVNVFADRIDLAGADNYWPMALLKERVVEWLRRGLLAGTVEGARLQIRGDMARWPFDGAEGRFEVIAPVSGGAVDYFTGWPAATGFYGTAAFVNTGMNIEGSIRDIGGVEVQTVRAGLEDFRNPVLEVEYASDSSVPRLIGFLRRSPLGERIGAELSAFAFVGPADTEGRLEVPLRAGAGGLDLEGRAVLRDAGFLAEDHGFELEKIGGTVRYDESGFAGEDLAAEYRGKPSRLSLRSDGAFEARMSGTYEVADIVPEKLRSSWPWLSHVRGSSEWEARLTAGTAPGGSGRLTELTLTSPLDGVALQLPAPLDKAAEEQWPMTLRLPLGEGPQLLELQLAERLQLAMDLPEPGTPPARVAIHLGAGETALPENGKLRIGGQAQILDLDGWIRLVMTEARGGRGLPRTEIRGLGGLALESSVVKADEIRLLDRRFEQASLSLESSGRALNAIFDSENIKGQLTFTGGEEGARSIAAEFERLVVDAPVAGGMKMEVDPAVLPTLHLYAESFRYSGIELGATRIEAYPKGDGLHFEKVEAESPNMSVRASGDWTRENGQHRSSFDIHMASESLGDFLRQLEFASPVEGGQTLVHFGVWWNGSPGEFGLARLNGDVEFSVSSGIISDANPGSGRLLGLLSVQSIPKRLALDFRDVFDSGFAFDEANGTFTMLNGSARTDDVTLTSAAANISLSGTTDLVARRYDQLITVRPGLGNTLPVIGAIAGGPGGAAAGLALQGLLGEQLGEASQVQYTITGAWDEPLIEPVLKTAADG